MTGERGGAESGNNNAVVQQQDNNDRAAECSGLGPHKQYDVLFTANLRGYDIPHSIFRCYCWDPHRCPKSAATPLMRSAPQFPGLKQAPQRSGI